MEWAMLPAMVLPVRTMTMVLPVRTVTLCQGSVGVPSCGRRGSSGFLLSRRITEKGVSLLC